MRSSPAVKRELPPASSSGARSSSSTRFAVSFAESAAHKAALPPPITITSQSMFQLPLRWFRIIARTAPGRSCGVGCQPAAEKQLPDLGIREDPARLARHARAPELDDDAEIRYLERALGVLLDHQDRHAFRAQVLQDREGLLDEPRGEADRGLVDQHQLGVEQQAARDLEQLLLAAGERRRLRRGALAQHR